MAHLPNYSSHQKKVFGALWLISFICLLGFQMDAQKDIYFKINHFLGDEAFVKGKKVTNDLGYSFKISRIDYILSNFVLHHDGGKTTALDSTYLLIRNGDNIQHWLGKADLESLDSISFFVGVDYDANHADPNLWPAGHALAPTVPDMHWGWASGYRFVAIEGYSGENLTNQYQIHALGDQLLSRTILATTGQNNGDELLVSLDADYIKSMNGLNLSKEIFVHGSTDEAKPFMINFRSRVFTSSSISSTDAALKLSPVKVSPNPTTNPEVQVLLQPEQLDNARIEVTNMAGQVIKTIESPSTSNEVLLMENGVYIIALFSSNQLTGRTVVVKN